MEMKEINYIAQSLWFGLEPVHAVRGFLSLSSLLFQEEQNRGKPNWEHLNDELHVLITVEDSENRAQLKLERAVDEVKKLLTVVSRFDIYFIPRLVLGFFSVTIVHN